MKQGGYNDNKHLEKTDLDLAKELPTEVLSTIQDTIEILDENYGTERTAEGLGVYIIVGNGIEKLNIN